MSQGKVTSDRLVTENGVVYRETEFRHSGGGGSIWTLPADDDDIEQLKDSTDKPQLFESLTKDRDESQ